MKIVKEYAEKGDSLLFYFIKSFFYNTCEGSAQGIENKGAGDRKEDISAESGLILAFYVV